MQTQKWLLTKISKDDRITPSKRLLCTLLLGYLEGIYPFTIIEDIYGNPNRLKFQGTEAEEREAEASDKVNKDAADDLRSLYKEFGNEPTKS